MPISIKHTYSEKTTRTPMPDETDSQRPWWTLFYDIHGNVSAKRVFGGLSIVTGLAMAALSGFHFYNVDAMAYGSVLATGSAILFGTAFERRGRSFADVVHIGGTTAPDPDDEHLTPLSPRNGNG